MAHLKEKHRLMDKDDLEMLTQYSFGWMNNVPVTSSPFTSARQNRSLSISRDLTLSGTKTHISNDSEVD